MLKLLHIIRFSFMFETYIILRLQYDILPRPINRYDAYNNINFDNCAEI